MTSERVPYTQAGRMMAISTPLGEDVLLLERLAIDEGVNGLFSFEAQVKSQRDDLRAADFIGASVDVRLKLKDDGTRWWNGFVRLEAGAEKSALVQGAAPANPAQCMRRKSDSGSPFVMG